MGAELGGGRRERSGDPGQGGGIAFELAARGEDAQERRLVLPVLARHRLERAVHLGVAAAQPREDRVLLVLRVQGERLGEVAAHAPGRVPDLGEIRARGGGEARRERGERPDPHVAVEEEADGVLGDGRAAEAGQHGRTCGAGVGGLICSSHNRPTPRAQERGRRTAEAPSCRLPAGRSCETLR